MMSNITDLKLVELVDKIKKKELSSTEVTIALLKDQKNQKNLMLIFLKTMKMQLKKQKYLIKNQTLKKNYLVYLLL